MEKKLNKKAQLNLNTVRTVMIAFLTLAIIAVAIVLGISELRDVAETIDTSTVTLTADQTNSVVNETGTFVDTTSSTARNCVLTATTVVNNSGTSIPSTNFTVSGCRISYAGTLNDPFNNTQWNVTGSYVFSNPTSNDVSTNISSGVTEFFDDTNTIFAILIVVVIILAIAIIISVVSRFGGGSAGLSGDLASAKSGGGGGGSTGFFGRKEGRGGASDTVMGI